MRGRPLIGSVMAALIQIASEGLFLPVEGQVDPGARIRVTVDSGSQRVRIGTLIALDADSLQFRPAKDSSVVSLAAASLTRIERSTRRTSNAGRGALIGALAGAGTGLILGLLASGEEGGFYEVGAGEVFAGSLLLGGLGAGVGALIGAATTGSL
jgi:hypothetical protein